MYEAHRVEHENEIIYDEFFFPEENFWYFWTDEQKQAEASRLFNELLVLLPEPTLPRVLVFEKTPITGYGNGDNRLWHRHEYY